MLVSHPRDPLPVRSPTHRGRHPNHEPWQHCQTLRREPLARGPVGAPDAVAAGRARCHLPTSSSHRFSSTLESTLRLQTASVLVSVNGNDKTTRSYAGPSLTVTPMTSQFTASPAHKRMGRTPNEKRCVSLPLGPILGRKRHGLLKLHSVSRHRWLSDQAVPVRLSRRLAS